jgi:hypothetical protein
VVAAARRTGDVQMVAPALTTLALVEYLDGDTDRVGAALQVLTLNDVMYPWAGTVEICRLLICSGDRERAREIVNRIDGGPRRTRLKCALVRAMLTETEDPGNAVALYRDSAREWAAWPNPLEQARALAGLARCLPHLGLFDEAGAAATQAQQILQRLGVADAARTVDIRGG